VAQEAISSSGGLAARHPHRDLESLLPAQLAGWKFVYRDTCSPPRSPETVSAFRAQQYRWAKGTVQTARNDEARDNSPLTLSQRVKRSSNLTPHFAYPLMVS